MAKFGEAMEERKMFCPVCRMGVGGYSIMVHKRFGRTRSKLKEFSI